MITSLDTNIAFDLHGTIDSNPEEFKEVMKKILQSGKMVYVISGSPVMEIEDELNKLTIEKGIHYNDSFSIVNFVGEELKSPIWINLNKNTKKLNWFCDDILWDSAKSLICQKYDIHVLFDDSLKYSAFFGPIYKTQFIHFSGDFSLIRENFPNFY